MSGFHEGYDEITEIAPPAYLSFDPTKRRDHYRQIMSDDMSECSEQKIRNILIWSQDAWSEIRKDCASWIKCTIILFPPEAVKLLFNAFVDCIRSSGHHWQAIHGSLLGINQMIVTSIDTLESDTVRTLCLSLVGSNLSPVREAATACISKLVATRNTSTAALISIIISSIKSLLLNCDDMIIANELDGLLGCLSDIIQASASLTSTNLLLLFKCFQEDSTNLGDYVFSPGGDGIADMDSPLLTGVIGTVDLLMGHASSIVRQHAGQVFLVLYNLLPEEGAEACSCSGSMGYRQQCQDFILSTSRERTDSPRAGEDVASGPITIGRGVMLRMLSRAILDKRRWRKQEVCLIISEEILQTTLVDSLNAMGLKRWNNFALSDSLHILLCAARECSCTSFLHPMFEIRRMHGQILPLIARASIIFQQELLVEELRIDGKPTCDTETTGLRHLISCRAAAAGQYEDGGVGVGAAVGSQARSPSDYRAAVFCVWIAALCNAAEHICELDVTKCNVEYQQALAEEGVSFLSLSPSLLSSSSSSPPRDGALSHCWAMEVAGRHSEEVSKKRYSASLKGVLCGGNTRSYRALARSLCCMKTVLSETSHLFISPEFLRYSSRFSDAPHGLMHIAHLPEVVSCDFIDAAALCVALMQRLGGDTDSDGYSEAALLVEGVKEIGVEGGDTRTSKAQLISPLLCGDNSLLDSNSDLRGVGGCCEEQKVDETYRGVPVYVLCMRSVMRSAKLASVPHMLSPGPSCRTTPSSSPMKSSGNVPSCRIDMTWCVVSSSCSDSDVSRKLAFQEEAFCSTSIADTSSEIKNNGEDDRHVGSPVTRHQCAAQQREIPDPNLDLDLHLSYDTSPLRRPSVSKTTPAPPSSSPAEQLSQRRLSPPLSPSPAHSSEAIAAVTEPSHPEQRQCPSSSSSTSSYARNCTGASSCSSWPLLPSLTDPTTDLCRGLFRVDGSAASAHQWLCESLAPLLPCLGCAVLAPTVADWALCIATNSLWMDGRVAARKALFSSLPLLVEQASHLLTESIPLSDTDIHHSANRPHVGSPTDTEQAYSYLCETVIACIAALYSDSPGLDPHSVSCLLRSLRLCNIRPPSPMTSADDDTWQLEGRGDIGSNTTCSDGERLGRNKTLCMKLVKSMAEYSLRHKNNPSKGEERIKDDNDDVVFSSSLSRSRVVTSDVDITADVTCSPNHPVHDFPSSQGNSDILVNDEEDETNDDFSDWDEDEEEDEATEVRSESRRGSFSFCLSSDIAAMLEEIALLEYIIT